ncbi:DNA primase [Anianabacter salinae]|uniref:DNA primase n=1 Tax=Anianabacter salinae TaxID=2851023 RepID=UPI00225E2417|nr:DNA primase [Anianabacter salinae]MBV0912812.1 DNA primase [Anianabacter salinae]
MSLPPGFLDEIQTRTSLSQIVGRRVTWDLRKSNQAKGDWWAPCPFHSEKTASFHVDDRKGFYYCFGCQAKGDAIAFLRQIDNMEFMEAVEVLAREAGMQMPAPDPEARQKQDRFEKLHGIMEQAVQFYRLQLRTGAGSAARDYLAGRGLPEDVIDRWELGYAPNGWEALREHLTGKGVAVDDQVTLGLARTSDKGRAPYDTFRNRVMFPIRDARGRAIAFGARALDPNDQAKYINSPETPLFHKGRTLYNIQNARAAAGKDGPLLVAEGYMDVIALSEAGFRAAVAPLGTAVTEDQLQLLWRIDREPVVTLDGDTAGQRAAEKMMDLALPQLSAERSLRFCLMPPGQDPDDLTRSGGPQAMRKLVEAAEPLVRVLWRRETAGKSFDSPERKAALDRALWDSIRKIGDQTLQRHYGEEIKRLKWDFFRPAARPGGPQGARGQGRGPRMWKAPEGPTAEARLSPLVADAASERRLREQVILAMLVAHPEHLLRFEGDLEGMTAIDPDAERLRAAILRNADADPETLADRIARDVGEDALEKLLSARHLGIIPAMRPGCGSDIVAQCIAEELAKLKALGGLEREIAEAVEDMGAGADEGLTHRLRQAADARNKALKSQTEDRTEYEIGPNGALISRDEKSAFESLLGQIAFGKGTKRPN